MGKEIAMNKYLVTLTPTGKFFFGGDMTFKSGRKNEDDKFSSYIIHSSMMPQQTSLLGMMRFLILSNDSGVFNASDNCIKLGKTNQDKVNKLIGEKSFIVSENHSKGNFGKISELGPCFLYNKVEKQAYFKAAMDKELTLDFSNAIKANINGKEMTLPEIKMKKCVDNDKKNAYYTGKNHLKSFYCSLNGTFIAEDKLFSQDSRIGIDKNYSGKTDNAAFYKQISYRLKEKFCFAFEIEVENDIDLARFNKQLVRVGADASCFVFEAKKINGDLDYPQDKDALRVVLISDSYIGSLQKDIEGSAKGLIRYAITQVRPFRFLSLSNSTDPSNYNVKYKTSRSEVRYDLYQAGSVFYFEDEADKNKFCEIIDSYKEFKQIGYNNYCK